MLTVRHLPASAMVAVTVLLGALGGPVGLGVVAWGTGVVCAAAVGALVAGGLRAAGADAPGPADLVTFARAVITCALAALTAAALVSDMDTAWFVPMAVVALVLDAVDGWVARRTNTCSSFGSRFDGEVDAFLILVLSVHAAPGAGAWILSAGVVRYGFAVAGWVLPWLRGRLPFRYWRKVVTATVGVVLTMAAADVRPHWFATGALVLGVALLAESFGRDVVWLWGHRAPADAGHAADAVDAMVRVPAVLGSPRAERV